MRAKILRIDEVGMDYAVRETAAVINGGRLAVLPTETVYGLAGRADDSDTLEKIFRAKERDRGKPVPLMLSGMEMLEPAGIIMSKIERAIADAFWPGPLTMVMFRNGIEEGIRIPDCAITQRILTACGGMLRVTSANQSGEEPALDAVMALDALGDRVDLILDGGSVNGGVPSTVVKCFNESFDILREGAISSASIESVLRNL